MTIAEAAPSTPRGCPRRWLPGANDLIDHAELLSEKRVTTIVITEPRTVDLRSLTPDQLLALAAAEDNG